MFKMSKEDMQKTIADMKSVYPEKCNSISPNGSKCTRVKEHKGSHHDYTGNFECFEMWG